MPEPIHPESRQPSPHSSGQPGAFIISLDFELHWGVRDRAESKNTYLESLLGARKAIPRMLGLFREFDVAATWATVGFLFAEDRRMMERFYPAFRPRYENAAFDPYREPVGECEADDPLHYGPELIRLIQRTPRQEIATHTFSHYYCLEAGQDLKSFAADLDSAIAIAKEYGVEIRSIVFPRNQTNPDYMKVLADSGIVCYRGMPSGSIYKSRPRSQESRLVRGIRWLDHHVGVAGSRNVRWGDVVSREGPCNVPASLFLRPVSSRRPVMNRLRLKRIVGEMRSAARNRRIFHLWWHPHNFGKDTDGNVEFLRTILNEFIQCRDRYGMVSMSMEEAADTAMRACSGRRRSHSGRLPSDSFAAESLTADSLK
jgi:hypothetical protein